MPQPSPSFNMDGSVWTVPPENVSVPTSHTYPVHPTYNNSSGGDLPVHFNIVTAVIYTVVFIVGLLGNTLAIYVVLYYVKMKTVTNMYILNLALADELYILGIPFLGTNSVLAYWPFGKLLCKVYMTADTMSQFASTFCLMVMSIDRYLAVVHPVRSFKWRKLKVAKIFSTMVWVVSFLIVLPVTLFSDLQEDFNTCNITWPDPQDMWSIAFILYTSILSFFGPLVVICLCYLLIVIRVNTSLRPSFKFTRDVSSKSVFQVRSASMRAGLTKRRRSERKVTRMVVVMVLVFLICWLPFFVTNIVNLIHIIPLANNTLYFITVNLTYLNSCINPFLYGFLSENFKHSFQKVLCAYKPDGAGTIDQRRVTQSTNRDLTRQTQCLQVCHNRIFKSSLLFKYIYLFCNFGGAIAFLYQQGAVTCTQIDDVQCVKTFLESSRLHT